MKKFQCLLIFFIQITYQHEINAWVPSAEDDTASEVTRARTASRTDPERAKMWRVEMNCATNAIYLLLRMKGHPTTYDKVEKAVPVSSRGTSLADVRRQAAALGLNARAIRASPESLQSCSLPAIAHLEEEVGTTGHYVVITSVSRGQVESIDGTTAMINTMPMSQFRKRWSGYLLVADADGQWDVKMTAISIAGWAALAVALLASQFRNRKPLVETPKDTIS